MHLASVGDAVQFAASIIFRFYFADFFPLFSAHRLPYQRRTIRLGNEHYEREKITWNQLLRFAYSWGHHPAIFLYLAETETDSLKDDINFRRQNYVDPHGPRSILPYATLHSYATFNLKVGSLTHLHSSLCPHPVTWSLLACCFVNIWWIKLGHNLCQNNITIFVQRKHLWSVNAESAFWYARYLFFAPYLICWASLSVFRIRIYVSVFGMRMRIRIQ